jgi:glutaredoxin
MSETPLKTVLYTRAGCHSCDQAAAVLSRHGLAFERVDIDADAALRARYNECVPVVVIDGKERFRGRIDELLLERMLAHRDRPE